MYIYIDVYTYALHKATYKYQRVINTIIFMVIATT